MKRLLASLLALAMVLGVCMMAGCGDDTTTTTTKSTQQTTTGNNDGSETTASNNDGSETTATTNGGGNQTTATTDNGGSADVDDPYASWDGKSKLPGYKNIDFRGAEFIIAGYEDCDDGYNTVREVYSEDTDSIAVAVRQRNEYIERLYNCTITFQGSTNAAGAASAEVTAGKQTIDLYSGKYWAGSAVTTGINYNLYSLGIDFTQEWWDQNYVSAHTLKNSAGTDCLYSIVGDFTFAAYGNTHALMVNKNVYATAVEGTLQMDMYELIRTGKWTMDRLAEMAKAAAKEVSGNDTLAYAEGDILGWLTTGHGTHGLLAASGLPLLDTVNGKYVFSATQNVAEWVSVIDKAQEMWNLSVRETVTYTEGFEALVSGQTLFNSNLINSLEVDTIAQSDTPIGLAPYPKYTETQETYMHYVDNHLTSYSVPISITDLDEMGAFFTIYAAHSTAIVRPAWIDAYAYDYCGDLESAEMLDKYILPNRSYDPGYLVISDVEGGFSMNVSSAKNNISRYIGNKEATFNDAITVFFEKLDQNKG